MAVLAGDDGILVIDDLLQPWTQKIRKAVSKIQKGPIKYLLNSHYHYDHAGSNAAFGGTSTIVAHKNVRKRLRRVAKPAHNLWMEHGLQQPYL